jgi:HK97 family phage major capsid protein
LEPVTKSVAATVRPVESEHPDGEFELVLADGSKDRDGQRLDPRDWLQPLPAKLHFDSDHAFRRGMSIPFTVGSGVPRLDGAGRIIVKGTYAGTDHGQLVRSLVNAGHIWTASVSFLDREQPNGRIKRELLNGTFTGVPSNTNAVVLSSKSLEGEQTMTSVAEAQIKALEAEFGGRVMRGECTDAEADDYADRWSKLNVQCKNVAAARRFAGCDGQYAGAPAEWRSEDPEVDAERYRGFARRKWVAPSPLMLTEPQLRQLHEAGSHAGSYGTRADMPGLDPATAPGEGKVWQSKDMCHNPNVGLKWTTPTSAAEGTPGSLIPPELLPTAFPLRIEPVRLFELFPGAAAGGQSVSWLQHSANAASASAVSELSQKPDLGPTIIAKTVSFTMIAGMLEVSRQFYDDFPAWGSFAPSELYRAVVDAENSQILTGNGVAPNMTGLLNTPNTLTRVANLGGSGQTSVTEIDVLRSAVMDLRQGPAYCEADLIVLNVMDWDYIQKLKNTLGSYILDATEPNSIGFVDNIFGTRVVATTKMPQGTALVMDTRIAVLAWTRLGMEILANQFDTYSWQNNAWSFRGEERIAIGVQYPSALNIVTGLNPSHGS